MFNFLKNMLHRKPSPAAQRFEAAANRAACISSVALAQVRDMHETLCAQQAQSSEVKKETRKLMQEQEAKIAAHKSGQAPSVGLDNERPK